MSSPHVQADAISTGRVMRVTAPSRLHFGMLSFGRPGVRQFGGVGAMIAAPGVRLTISRADRITADGPMASRAVAAAKRFITSSGLESLPGVHIQILSAPRPHVGLGSGTQLALSVAAGLSAFFGEPVTDATVVAHRVGRAKRSAVGTHGFAHGGLIVDGGKLTANDNSPLVARVALPSQWRFALFCPRDAGGLYGSAEQLAFEQLPPVPARTTERLCDEIHANLLPAAAAGQFSQFGESLYRFGRLAGSCFAAQQGGDFAGPQIVRIVNLLRSLGVRGVGQTSWGPTVFALMPNEQQARDLVDNIAKRPEARELDVTIAAPANHGARIECDL